MSPAIQALLVLQDRDRRLRGMTEDLERLPKEEARAKERLAGDQAAVKKAREEMMANEVEIKKVELDVGTRRTTIARLKTQQFETRKNDEYTALGHEVTRYEKEVDGLETKELELMERADALRGTLTAAEQALAKTQQRVDEDLTQFAERRKRVEGEAAELRAERGRLAAQAPEDQLPLYERLLKTKNGIAIVPAVGGKCSGCHMKLVASTMVKVNSGVDGTQCESCGRLLYSDEA
jgi:predicted  nucleic acid-binding Zn-ribbon protein